MQLFHLTPNLTLRYGKSLPQKILDRNKKTEQKVKDSSSPLPVR